MLPKDVINSVKAGKFVPGWAIFKYNLAYVIYRFVTRSFFFVVFSVVAVVLFILPPANDKVLYFIFGVAFSGFALTALLLLLNLIYEMMFFASNMIVFTENEIVKSFKGKIHSYHYDSISDFKFTNPMGTTPGIFRTRYQYIDFKDIKTNKIINLTRNRIFGKPEFIYTIINNKNLKVWNQYSISPYMQSLALLLCLYF